MEKNELLIEENFVHLEVYKICVKNEGYFEVLIGIRWEENYGYDRVKGNGKIVLYLFGFNNISICVIINILVYW